MWRYISVLLLFVWQVFALALRYGGDIQTVQTWAEQRGEIVKYAAIVSTWPFTPIILFMALLVVWLITEFGWPWKIQKHREAEQAVYDQTIAAYRDGEGLPINCFYRAGGFKLTRQGIRAVCTRLGKVNANPLPTVPKGQWVKFIRRAQTVGRPMETVEQALEAFDEWKKTKTLKPPWDLGAPSGDSASPTPEIPTSTFSEPIALPRKLVVVNAPSEQRNEAEARVSYEETTEIIDIFKTTPQVKVAVTCLGVQAGEEFRPVMERAGWFREALKKAGVNATGGAVWGTLGSVPDGTSIWWIKNHQNNDMVNRIIRAAKIKGMHPRPVDRSVSAGECEIELMIGRNPTRPS
jgi:hypothetical protein